MSTKIEVINKAYSKLRISGLTVNPTPENVTVALGEYESMMAEFFTGYNLDVGYNFENMPNVNSQTTVPIAFENMMVTNLATRLISNFNKAVPAVLTNQASQSLSKAIGTKSIENARQIQPSRRMPRGSGNTIRSEYWSRYTIPVPLPPNVAATNRITESETQDYQEDFSAYLGDETIASFTIVSDPRLTLVSSANNDPVIDYRVTANTTTSTGPFQQVQIELTTSSGRIEVRNINFEVYPKAEVG